MKAKLVAVAARAVLKTKKHSPAILFVAGIVGVTASTVAACAATLKVEDILEEAKYDREKAEIMIKSENAQYSIEDYEKDQWIIKSKCAAHLVQAYAPAVVLAMVGIACLTKSHRILATRNNALMAAYASLDKAYKVYRQRVAEEIGEDKERELYHDVQRRALIIPDENGATGAFRKESKDISMYARFYDECAKDWQREPEYNYLFLRCQQNYANDLLKNRGHIFLNEVYDLLGLDRSKAGQMVGWVKNNGDSYVDFGIFTRDDLAEVRAFVNGYEKSILLDFNVDGAIYDLI